jgi:hypothetical protein
MVFLAKLPFYKNVRFFAPYHIGLRPSIDFKPNIFGGKVTVHSIRLSMMCRFYIFSHFQAEYFRPITNISSFRRSSRTRHFYINRSYLSKVYSTISPDDDKPLVLVLEECDKLITNVIQGNVKPHLYIPIPMMDKSDWNSMLDKVTDLGFYPNLILILTSNVSRDELHELDASILRDGRIDKAYHMKMV